MASSLKASNILIFGATGFIGTYITEKIITAQPAFDRVTIFTSPERAASKSNLFAGWQKQAGGHVSVVTGSVDSEADVKAAYREHHIDTVVCALGRGAIAKQIALLRWADEGDDVRWFLPSEYGTDVEYYGGGPDDRGRDEKPHQQKLRVRDFVRDGGVRRVAVTYVVTGPYFESWAREVTPSGIKDIAVSWFDVAARETQLIEDGAGRIGFTSMPDVGEFVVAALRHPDEATATTGGGKALRVQSFVATPNEVVAEYERQTETAWKVSYVSLADVRVGEARLWAEDHPKATVVTLRRIWAEGGTLYDTTDNEAIGVRAGETETMGEVLRRLL